MKSTFTMVVERDPESQWLVGEVVELPGCYTQAPDMRRLEAHMREAISAYLQTADPDEHRPDFVGTWRVEVTAWPGCALSRIGSCARSPRRPDSSGSGARGATIAFEALRDASS